MAELRRVANGTVDYFGYLKERIKYIKRGVINGSSNALNLLGDLNSFDKKAKDLDMKIHGDASLAKREFETLPGFIGTLEGIISNSWSQSAGATKTHEDKYNKLKAEFKPIYNSVAELKTLVKGLEQKAEDLKMPATTGRLPKLKE
jgi:hypothetical protein